MRIVSISDPEAVVMELQDEIRRSEDSRYHHRLHGVLLVAQGLHCSQAADLLGDAPRAIAYWVERYEEKGLAGLREKSRSGRPKKLNSGQLADLQRVIPSQPSEMGLAGNLWDGKTISVYLGEKHGVELSTRQCRRLLRQWKSRSRKRAR